MIRRHILQSLLLIVALSALSDADDNWSQFRGPNGSGRTVGQGEVPVDSGSEENLLWRCPVTRGLSSPCIRSGRVFLTEFDSEKSQLSVVSIDRDDGSVLWRKHVPAEEIEKVHKTSSPANATVAADDERIYVYFASCGLFCFDHDGNAVWDYPVPVSRRINGSGTSPVVIGERVILNREDDQERYLLALNAATGEEIWKQLHGSLLSRLAGGYSMGEATPILWNGQIVLHRHNELAAYALADGKRQWTFAVRTTAASTPVIEDNVLYVAAWNNFGEPDLEAKLPEFEVLVEKHDKNNDALLSREELPWGPAFSQRPELAGRNLGGNIPVKLMFSSVDQDRDGNLSKQEWDAAAGMSRMMIAGSKHGMTAIRLNERNDRVTPTELWVENKSVPEVPSPLVIGDHVYMIKNGGILTCLDKATGKIAYRRRLQAAGPYFASLVAANESVFAASGDGVLTVFQAGDEFELISSHDFGEPIYATPAIVDGMLYVRTDEALYAFVNR